MSIIPCARDCIHQQDGYCGLETTAQVTNTSGGCAHYERRGKAPRTGQPPDRPSGAAL